MNNGVGEEDVIMYHTNTNVGNGWNDETSPLNPNDLDDFYETVNQMDTRVWGGSEPADLNELPEDLLSDINGMTKRYEPEVPQSSWYFTTEPTEVSYKDDIVQVPMSPETLYQILNVLKRYSVNIPDIGTFEQKFEEQTRCREYIATFNNVLEEYVRIRPWDGFIVKWCKTIGMEKVRNCGSE